MSIRLSYDQKKQFIKAIKIINKLNEGLSPDGSIVRSRKAIIDCFNEILGMDAENDKQDCS